MDQASMFKGRKEKPSYEIESGTQPTLDAFRAYSIFQEITAEIGEEISGSIDSAVMYGSNVNGLSAFPDSETYNWNSDMDLLYAVRTEDIDTVRQEIEGYIGRLEFPVQPNVDVRDADEISETLENIHEADSAEEIMEQDFKISYPDHYFQKSVPKRMRAFATGFIPHRNFDGEVVTQIEKALDNLIPRLEDPMLRSEFQEDARDYTSRKKEMRDFNRKSR